MFAAEGPVNSIPHESDITSETLEVARTVPDHGVKDALGNQCEGVSLSCCQAISRVDIDEFGDADRFIAARACAAETEASTRPVAVVAPLAWPWTGR